jgi:hypothetical protein
MKPTLSWLLAGALFAAAPFIAAAPAAAQEALQEGPRSLVIQYRTSAANRTAFRTYLAQDLATRLKAMRGRGEIEDFRIFYSWYRQPDVWDGLVILRFPNSVAVEKWNTLERSQPGGLDARGLALADPVATYSTDLSWSRNPDALRPGTVYYIIPYEYRNADEYGDYVKAYVLPQFDGWIGDGALNGYEIYMNRYSTGAPWDSLFIQHYRDMSAFGRRAALTEATRVKLRENAEWKAWSDRKAGIRSESENSIAELIAH